MGTSKQWNNPGTPHTYLPMPKNKVYHINEVSLTLWAIAQHQKDVNWLQSVPNHEWFWCEQRAGRHQAFWGVLQNAEGFGIGSTQRWGVELETENRSVESLPVPTSDAPGLTASAPALPPPPAFSWLTFSKIHFTLHAGLYLYTQIQLENTWLSECPP